MPATIHQLSPAKINLMLRILGQRADGYHLLQTYFQLLNWGDDITFKCTERDCIHIDGNFNNLKMENNLIFRAIQLLKPHRTIHKGLEISVHKRIPQGSGLGGGSSNAGTTLNTINQLWQCHLNQQQLLKMALQLGADVPIFVFNKSAMAYGVGEQLLPLSLNTKYYFVLIFPSVAISTVEVFNHKALFREDKKMNEKKIHDKTNWTNTCLPIVLNHFPEVAKIHREASDIAPTYMSGTGSTLFCCFDSLDEAKQFLRRCPEHWQTQICESAIN